MASDGNEYLLGLCRGSLFVLGTRSIFNDVYIYLCHHIVCM